IQVRSILEDAWSEWEHELFYKRRRTLSEAAWSSLRLLHDKEKKQISDSLFEAAKTLDRMGDVFDITSRPLPEHVSRELTDAKKHRLDNTLVGLIGSEPFRIDIAAANLTTGLLSEQLTVDWKKDRFIGLQLEVVGQATKQAKETQRFAF